MDELIVTLLGLNFLGVLYISIKVSRRPKQDHTQQRIHQKLIEQIITMKQEVADLKTNNTRQYQMVIAEMKRLSEKRARVEAAAKPTQTETLFLNDRYREVFELYHQGLTVDEIAKKLEKGNGEIDFILQLAGSKKGDQR